MSPDYRVSAGCPAWAPPLLAVQFLTRVPVPGVSRLSAEAVRVGLGRAVAWFPLIGAVVGSITAGVMVLSEQIWPRLVAVILALLVEARLTGAFHEDAVADFCDGIGGGRDAAHTQQIMKDSRIGSYGALGLGLAVALRAALMYALDPMLAVQAIIGAATLGRLLTVVVMATTPAASSAGRAPTDISHGAGSGANDAHSVPASASLANDITARIRTRDVAFAFLLAIPGLLPFAYGAPLRLVCAVLATVIFLIWFRPLLIRRLGGTTGDCLGFAAYVGQLLLLMAATAS
jgi:adenosylcobinamide-GDP ribazoletransferase